MNNMLRWMPALLVTILGLGWAPPAAAWGDSGHRTVCEIALRNLTPTARAEVDRLLHANAAILGANPNNAELGWACTYPDHPAAAGPGRRSPEHFVNYARTLLIVAGTSGCGGAPQCVVTAIAGDFAILRSGAPDAQRAAALVYLGHWFGDIHQPLHSSYRDDQGGNEMGSSGLCTNNLHSTWDTCILQSRALPGTRSIGEVRALAMAWSGQVSDTDRAQWLSSAPWIWSAESYAVTVKPETGYCVIVQGACQYSATNATWSSGEPRRSVRIDAAYMDMAMPIIQRRITQAGVRLGHWLNLALDPAYRG